MARDISVCFGELGDEGVGDVVAEPALCDADAYIALVVVGVIECCDKGAVDRRGFHRGRVEKGKRLQSVVPVAFHARVVHAQLPGTHGFP